MKKLREPNQLAIVDIQAINQSIKANPFAGRCTKQKKMPQEQAFTTVKQFFNGSNNVAAEEVIEVRNKNQHKVKQLLAKLKNELINEGKEINPFGPLARCINTMQTNAGIVVIELDEINAVIRSKTKENLPKDNN